MTHALVRGKADLLIRLIFVPALSFFLVAFPSRETSAQDPVPAATPPPAAAPTEPPAPAVPTPEEPTEAPTPVLLPGEPAPPDVVDVRTPGPTAPPPAPGLVDRFQRRLDVMTPPGRIFFGVSVDGEYDDNVFQESRDTKDDFRIMIVPAVGVEQTTGKASLRLLYTPRILEYVRFRELNRIDHSLVAAASWDPNPRVRFSVQESFILTEDTIEASALGISDTGLRRTTRNEVSPAVQMRVSPRSDLGFRYTNTITNQSGSGEERGDDSTIHSGGVTVSHRFRRATVGVGYVFTAADFTESSDFTGHEATLNTSWRLGPRDDLLVSGGAVLREQKTEPDYAIFNASLGLRHQFSPRLAATVNGGIQQFDERNADPVWDFFTNSSLAWTFPRGSFTLRFERRFTETFATVDNRGVVDVIGGSGSFHYQVGPRLALSVNGSYFHEDFRDENRLDQVTRVGAELRYRLTGPVFISAGYTRFDRNSDFADNDLTTNRFFVGLSLGMSAPLPFF